MVGFLVIFTAFFQWLSGFIIITRMTSIYSSKVSFTGGEEGSLSFQGSISCYTGFCYFQKWLPPSPFSDENPQREDPAWCLEAIKWQHSTGINRDHTVPAWSLASSQSSTTFPLLCCQCGAKWGSSKVQLSFLPYNWQGMENEQKWLLLTSGKQEC